MENGKLDPNAPLRMYIALRVLRAWNSGTMGFDSITVRTVNDWIDAGMKGPIPWPESPFFGLWAAAHGYSNVDGYIGFRLKATLCAPLES